MDINLIYESLKTDAAITILIFSVVVLAMVFLASIYQKSVLQKEIQKLKRKLEVSSVSKDESSDKVKLLEDKVKTLETALEKALNK